MSDTEKLAEAADSGLLQPRLVRLERIVARGLLRKWMEKYAPTCRPGGWDYDKEAAALCEETAELLETKVPW